MQDEKLHIKKELIKNLEELTQEEGFLYSFCRIIFQSLFLDIEKIAEINWHERLNYQEINLLLGLMVKHRINLSVIPTEEKSSEHLKRASDLFEKLHLAHIQHFPKIITDDKASPDDKEKASNDFFSSGAFMSEPIFYGGTGAYDFQYWEFAPLKYKEDSAWIKENKGISISEIVNISTRITKSTQLKLDKLRSVANFSDFCKTLLMILSFTKEELLSFNKEDVEKFIEYFSVIPGTLNAEFDSMGKYNIVDSHPIIALEDNLYFLPIGFYLAQSIYESPFYWMAKDEKYKDNAFKNRGSATEEIAFDLLKNVFGKENVYRNVRVCKNNGDDITDIDVLAIAGNKAVIIQAKSKKLTELSRRGDDEQLKIDFRNAVQKAYDQGVHCRTSLINKTNVLFTKEGKKLKLQESVDDAYIICLTTDHYPAITQQTSFCLEKKIEDPFPLAMNIFDFDIVTFYLKDPFELLYYLRQRINLSSYFIADSEMTFLGFHIKHKLFPKKNNINREALNTSFAQLIDANFPALRGYTPKTEGLEILYPKWKNLKFEKLISQIKSLGIAGFTDAIFYFYDLAGNGADDLINQIEIAKKKTLIDNKMHDFSLIYEDGKSGISFLSYPSSGERMGHILMELAKARKYKTKADIWVGLGSMPNSHNIIDSVVFSKEPWVKDNELEELTKVALKEGVPVNLSGKKTGRNDPCLCGSGKKYKKCHGNAMQS